MNRLAGLGCLLVAVVVLVVTSYFGALLIYVEGIRR